MRVLSSREAAAWCHAHDVALSEYGLPDRSDAALRFEIPEDAQKRVVLVNRAMQTFGDESHFLVWFDDWAVWPSGQRMHVFDRFRMSYGETRRLIDSPGHLFDGTEIEDGISFVTISTLFLWDCYVVNPGRTKLLYLSHDEYGVAKRVDPFPE
jgi:hypothetical protein